MALVCVGGYVHVGVGVGVGELCEYECGVSVAPIMVPPEAVPWTIIENIFCCFWSPRQFLAT